VTNTCSGCPSTWTGTTKCHCSAVGCHRTFGSIFGFDAHRQAEPGHCTDPAALRTKDGRPVLELRDGIWIRRGAGDYFSKAP